MGKRLFLLRFFILILASSPLFLTLNCTQITKVNDLDSSLQETAQLKKYKSAQAQQTTNPEKSCELYQQLSNENFPLQSLALVKSHLICRSDKVPPVLSEKLLPLNSAQILSAEPWLMSLDVEREILEAKNNSEKVQALIRKAQWIQNSPDNKGQKKKEITNLLLSAQKEVHKTVPGEIGPLNLEDSQLEQKILSSLYQSAPRLNPSPRPPELISVAQDWINQRQYDKAREILAQIKLKSELSAEEKYQAIKLTRNSYKTEQNKQEHLIACKKLIYELETKNEAPVRILESYTTYARALWTEGQINEAQKVLTEAEKKLSNKISLEEIDYIRGRMAEEKKDFDIALMYYQKAKLQSRDKNTLKEKILFSLAWTDRKLGKFGAAADAFAELKEMTKDPFDKNRYWFWYTKSLQQSFEQNTKNILVNNSAETIANENKKSATIQNALAITKNDNDFKTQYIKEYKDLISNDPLGYYGILAHREIDEKFTALNNSTNSTINNQSAKTFDSTEMNLIQSLAYVEENDILVQILDLKSKKLREQKNYDKNTWLYLLKWYAKAGQYQPLFQQIGKLDSEMKNQLFQSNPELLFPMKYKDLVLAAALKFQVEPAFIFSIIRQESSFNPQARSPVNAYGLMQLMPNVAQELYTNSFIEKKLKEEKIAEIPKGKLFISEPETLYDTKTNILLGTALLSQLQKKFNNQFILKTAAYNANEKAIHGWLKTRWNHDPIEFIEDIPYEETRSYVKLVLRNYIFYSRMAQPDQSIAFPDKFLDLAIEATSSVSQL